MVDHHFSCLDITIIVGEIIIFVGEYTYWCLVGNGGMIYDNIQSPRIIIPFLHSLLSTPVG